MKKLIFILPLLYYSCTDDIVSDIDALTTQNADNNTMIDSLLTAILDQQEYIDSLNNVQQLADSLNNLLLQSYIDSLISMGNVSDSLIQAYSDSLNNVQNTLDTEQQAYIDSLINTGNISDSLLQVYADSLNAIPHIGACSLGDYPNAIYRCRDITHFECWSWKNEYPYGTEWDWDFDITCEEYCDDMQISTNNFDATYYDSCIPE